KDSSISQGGVTVSPEVLAHRPLIEKYGKEYGIEDYVSYILAIMQVESGGTAEDVMQSSESLGLPPNSLSTEESIKQGVKYFSELLTSAEQQGVDIDSVIQSYNYGGGFLNYVRSHGKKYTYELAEQFSKEKSGGQKADYPNPIAIPVNGGWRYNYGNQFYVQLVSQYLTDTSPTEFDDETVQVIMDEALKYEGFPYVFGGASPTTSFDCSGLIQWVYDKAGISLPRVAQDQYDATQEISMEEAQAGDPIGYGDLSSRYWQDHLIGARRVIHN
ncbi:TPA: lysozyme family protein, partial [Streptococcus agalactiae]